MCARGGGVFEPLFPPPTLGQGSPKEEEEGGLSDSERRGKERSGCLTCALFPKKKFPCGHVSVSSSFLPGKSVGHCVPACVIINNNHIFLCALRDFLFAINM